MVWARIAGGINRWRPQVANLVLEFNVYPFKVVFAVPHTNTRVRLSGTWQLQGKCLRSRIISVRSTRSPIFRPSSNTAKALAPRATMTAGDPWVSCRVVV